MGVVLLAALVALVVGTLPQPTSTAAPAWGSPTHHLDGLSGWRASRSTCVWRPRFAPGEVRTPRCNPAPANTPVSPVVTSNGATMYPDEVRSSIFGALGSDVTWAVDFGLGISNPVNNMIALPGDRACAQYLRGPIICFNTTVMSETSKLLQLPVSPSMVPQGVITADTSGALVAFASAATTISVFNLTNLSSNFTFTRPSATTVDLPPVFGYGTGIYFGEGGTLVYADARNGTVLWRQGSAGAHIKSLPAVALGGRVFLGGRDGVFRAFHSSGLSLWSTVLDSAGSPINSSPALSLSGDAVYVASPTNTLFALNTRTGSVIWKMVLTGILLSSPVLGTGNILYISGFVQPRGNLALHAVDTQFGALIWSKFYDTLAFNPESFLAISMDGSILVSSRNGTVCEIACEPCPTGSAGETECIPCAPGSYSESPGALLCTLCPAGTYLPTRGATSSRMCVPCPPGWISVDGSSSCFARPQDPPTPMTDATTPRAQDEVITEIAPVPQDDDLSTKQPPEPSPNTCTEPDFVGFEAVQLGTNVHLRMCAARNIFIYGEVIVDSSLVCSSEPFVTQVGSLLVMCSASFLWATEPLASCGPAASVCPNGPQISTNASGDLIICSPAGIRVGANQLALSNLRDC